MNNINILDCTLRDGGYYNDWDFDNDLIVSYLSAMKKNNISFVEIGLRSLKNNGFKGVTAYCPDFFLDSLDIDLNYGVMVNGSELLDGDMEEILEKLFPRVGNNTKIKLVRIACHFHEFEPCLDAVDWLKNNGFIVGFNLMQISERSDSEVLNVSKIASKHNIDVLYFADSMGCMNPNEVSKKYALLRTHWSGDIGIHTHDNMGLALSNTVEALKLGAQWVDATVTGMGRGPGNTKIEELLLYLNRSKSNDGITSLFDCIEHFFNPLQQKYQWGKNEYYYLSGKYGIHPTYIQFMLSDERYDSKDILAVIDFLKENNGNEFSEVNINKALGFFKGSVNGKNNINDIEKKDILIIGTGPSIIKHKDAIESFIEKKDLLVLALNSKESIDETYINYRIASHPLSIMADIQKYKSLSSTLITPYSMLPSEISSMLDKDKVFDFGIEVTSSDIDISSDKVKIPNSYVLTYALAFSISIKPDSIFLAGFDGYGDITKNNQNDLIFKSFENYNLLSKLISITPSKYDITCQSIYGLL